MATRSRRLRANERATPLAGPGADDKKQTGKALQGAVLRFIAREEPLLSTLGAFPQLARVQLQRALEKAATLLEGGAVDEVEQAPAGHRLRL